MTTIEAWDDRWKALEVVTNAMIEKYDRPGEATVQALGQLARRLQVFGRDHYAFFKRGLDEHYLIPDEDGKYTQEFVRAIILQQISGDLEVIERAATQRLYASSAMQAALKQADALATRSLDLAVKLGLLTEPSLVITYFQKSAAIRTIPYAPVALIGVPYTCLKSSRDYLAIPHEVGHHVFWNGRVSGVPIYEHLRENVVAEIKALVTKDNPFFLAWGYNWREEIFADLYGCLVAGPVMALDFQDWMLQSAQPDFVKDDHDHPLPMLRPNVYHKVLMRQSQHLLTDADTLGQLADILHQRWIAARWALSRGSAEILREAEQNLYVKDVISDGLQLSTPSVDRVIQVILRILLDEPPVLPDKWPEWPVWSGTEPEITNLVAQIQTDLPNLSAEALRRDEQQRAKLEAHLLKLYQAFSSHLATLQNVEPNPQLLALTDDKIAPQAIEQLRLRAGGQQASALWKAAVELNRHVQYPTEKLPFSQWKKILYARGWATKGPNGPSSPPPPK